MAEERERPDAPIDSDVDLRIAGQREEVRHWDVLVAIAVGGVIGAEARYGLGVAVSAQPPQFPWVTVLVNASGCLAIGVLMVVLLELATPRRLTRPFLGVGVLGGYTTFSTFAVDAVQLVRTHRPGSALGYVALTVLDCAAAVWVATWATRWWVQRRTGR